MANRHDAMSARRRFAGTAIERLVSTGLPGAVARSRTSLDPNLGIGGDSSESALALMASGIESADSVAITLGPRRYNRKPVVQIMDPTGRSLAFAKLACDPATAVFVDNETQWLRRAGSAGFAAVRVPEVIADGAYNNKALLTVSAVPPDGHRPNRLDAARLAAMALDVAAISSIEMTTVDDSRALDQIEQCAADANDTQLTAAAAAVRGAFGERALQIGAWHGDFSPWNMLSTDTHTWLIDWEFAGDAMPVGADLLHNRVMVQTHLNSVDINAALAALPYAADGLLASVGSESDTEAALAIYLLELRRRDAMLASLDAPPTDFGAAALQALAALTSGGGQ